MNISIDNINLAIGITAGAITALGGIWTAYRHVSLSSKIRKDVERKSLLDEAKRQMDKVEATLTEKIKDLETELQTQKESIQKDFSHMREVYNAEIKVLGEKIDSLRSDLSEQHSSMVALLTKLVNSR